jgi:hypothetical protein
MAPMPPPPPKGGMSGAMIALLAIIAFVVLGGGTCVTFLCIRATGVKKTESTASAPTTPVKAAPAHSAPSNENNWITSERPSVKFHPPVGWSTEITPDKEWGIFKSPARDAVFAFTTFSRPGESTVRLGKVANVLGVADIDWRTPRYGTIGRDKYNAHIGDGTCNFKGPNGYIWYATVNPGGDEHQILLVFTVSASAPKARRDEAQAAIDSLQRR